MKAQKEVIDYVNKFSIKEAFLYNNRLFTNQINPTQEHKDQYNANWEYLKNIKN